MVVFHKLVLLAGSVIVVTVFHTGFLQDKKTPQDFKEAVAIKIICPGNEDTAYYKHETDKSLFYKCIGGNGMVMSCPEGSVFDSEFQRCSYTENGAIRDLVIEKNVEEFENFVPLDEQSVESVTTVTWKPFCTTVFPGPTDYITSTWLCNPRTPIHTTTNRPTPPTSTTTSYPIISTCTTGFTLITGICTTGTYTSSSTYVPTSTLDPYCTSIIPDSTTDITSTWLCTSNYPSSSGTYIPTSTSTSYPSTSTSTYIPSSTEYPTSSVPSSTDTTSTEYPTSTVEPSSSTVVPTSTSVPSTTSNPTTSTSYYPTTTTATDSTSGSYTTSTYIPSSTEYPTSSVPSSTGTTSTDYPTSTVEPSSSTVVPSSSTDGESTSWINPTSTSVGVVPTAIASATVTPVLPSGVARLIVV